MQKKKRGVKNVWKFVLLRGGRGVRRLMANAILNFHFVFLEPFPKTHPPSLSPPLPYAINSSPRFENLSKTCSINKPSPKFHSDRGSFLRKGKVFHIFKNINDRLHEIKCKIQRQKTNKSLSKYGRWTGGHVQQEWNVRDRA